MKVKSKFKSKKAVESPKFNTGDLVYFNSSVEHGDRDFVVLVTGEGSTDIHFSGVTVWAADEAIWGLGHFANTWIKESFVDCPVGSTVTLKVKA